MKPAVSVSCGSSRVFIRSLLALALLMAAGIGSASAQSAAAPPAATQGPPVSVSGWRYERSGPDLHIFYCDQPGCGGAGSKVSYKLYPPNSSMTLEEFRAGQGQIVKALEQRTPGLQITMLGVEGDQGTAVPRIFKARRLAVRPDGAKEYQVSSWLFGARAIASLISTARDEKVCNDNYAKFAVAVMLLLAPKTR